MVPKPNIPCSAADAAARDDFSCPPLPLKIRLRRFLRVFKERAENADYPHPLTAQGALREAFKGVFVSAICFLTPAAIATFPGAWLNDARWAFSSVTGSWPPFKPELADIFQSWLNPAGAAFLVIWGVVVKRVQEQARMWIPLATALALVVILGGGNGRWDSTMTARIFAAGGYHDRWRSLRDWATGGSALFLGSLISAWWWMADCLGKGLTYAVFSPMRTLTEWLAMRNGTWTSMYCDEHGDTITPGD